MSTDTTTSSLSTMAAVPVRLPTELIRRTLQLLERSKDYRSLGRVQRASRQMYLIATPLLYVELGDSFRDVRRRLAALGGLSRRFIESSIGVLSSKHPIDLGQAGRLIWMCSNVKRIILRPQGMEHIPHNDWTAISTGMNALNYVLKSRATEHHQSHQPRLFPSLEGIVIDLSYLKGSGWVTAPSSLAIRTFRNPPYIHLPQHAAGPAARLNASRLYSPPMPNLPDPDVWNAYTSSVFDTIFILAAHVPPTDICVKLHGFDLNHDLRDAIQILHPVSVTFHHHGILKWICDLPVAKYIIMDAVPGESSRRAQYSLFRLILRNTTNPQLARTKLLVANLSRPSHEGRNDRKDDIREGKKRDSRGDIGDRGGKENRDPTPREARARFVPGNETQKDMDEREFNECMDKLVSQVKDTEDDKVTMTWGYLNDQGRVKGCDRCSRLYAQNTNAGVK